VAAVVAFGSTICRPLALESAPRFKILIGHAANRD
jgi:hypothetical protein